MRLCSKKIRYVVTAAVAVLAGLVVFVPGASAQTSSTSGITQGA